MCPLDASHSLKCAWMLACSSAVARSPSAARRTAERRSAIADTLRSRATAYRRGSAKGLAAARRAEAAAAAAAAAVGDEGVEGAGEVVAVAVAVGSAEAEAVGLAFSSPPPKPPPEGWRLGPCAAACAAAAGASPSRAPASGASLDPSGRAAPPHSGPGPPTNGITSGANLSGSSSEAGAAPAALLAAAAAADENGDANAAAAVEGDEGDGGGDGSGGASTGSLPTPQGASHLLGSVVTPARAICARRRAYLRFVLFCVFLGGRKKKASGKRVEQFFLIRGVERKAPEAKNNGTQRGKHVLLPCTVRPELEPP